jgi:hypothetical protein
VEPADLSVAFCVDTKIRSEDAKDSQRSLAAIPRSDPSQQIFVECWDRLHMALELAHCLRLKHRIDAFDPVRKLSQLLSCDRDFHNLVAPLKGWDIESVFVGNLLAHKTSANEMPAFEPLTQRFRRCQ